MKDALSKIKIAIDNLKNATAATVFRLNGLSATESEFKSSNVPPCSEYTPYTACRGKFRHFWIKGEFDTLRPSLTQSISSELTPV